jgi:cytochrome c biogenesis protein CcmG/thiol:disulfide interchange protein DsbE
LAGIFLFDVLIEKGLLMMKRLILLSIVVMTLAAGCTDRGAQQGPLAAPDFTLQGMDGKTVRLSDHKGKVVLLEFWATWCPPCRESVPGLQKLHNAYKDKGLVVLAVSMDQDNWEEVTSFIAERHITYTVLKGNAGVAEEYRVRALPMTVIINKEGNISKRYLGMGSDEEVEKDVKAVL